MTPLTIFILCHNRPAFARQAIESAKAQVSQNFLLVVSDNSSNNDVERMVRSEHPDVHFIRRAPMLKALEHFNCCIDEVQTDYFCLFHDDDILTPHFSDAMLRCLYEHPEAIACGCNALVQKSDRLKKRTSFQSFRRQELIATPLNLARRYFSRAQSGIAPFPGYVYDRQKVGDSRFQTDGGKYADASWLLGLAMKAPIVWVSLPLMIYRVHEGNDGSIESNRDRLRFLGFLKQNARKFDGGLLQDYRYFLYKKILNDPTARSTSRLRLAASFVRRYRWLRYVRPDYYAALVARGVTKLAGTR